ncbi:MAG: VOC family protein [Deltaproteobacteria bacterium]|uniref:VOC family protein n=1 Tax=Candidatus Zymogenus saltonus TaxID=2844893 RepID=A0A9D8KGP2_9DELT|nr:VOC family protein [Candidatus Zymogenus saltonus]
MEEMHLRFDHVGIKSKDIKKSVDFYTRILGFEVLEEVEVLNSIYTFVGDETTRIEIEQAAPNDKMIDVNTQYGLYHIAFIVKDIDSLAERLKKDGVKFIMEPIQLREDRKIAFIEDPDGVRIQLIDFFE